MRVRWTAPAADDLILISDYTQDHFGTAHARRTAVTIHDAAESLQALPERGRPGRQANTRS
jgi:plasmid stabilization system protein ParE